VTLVPVGLDLFTAGLATGLTEWLRAAVETAVGWPGLVVVAVYSFLIAVVLPLPSELVLAAPLELGVGPTTQFVLVVLVSASAKAAGSLVAFHIGQGAKQSGPVLRALERSRFDVVEWSQRRAVALARRWGYLGLALLLSVPFFPDTVSIYAFAILERDYVKFAAATFVGSALRLLLTAGALSGLLHVW